MSNRDRRRTSRFFRDIFRDQLFEHGAFGRGLGVTLDQTTSPHNSLLGDMPHQPESDEDEDELEESHDSIAAIISGWVVDPSEV